MRIAPLIEKLLLAMKVGRGFWEKEKPTMPTRRWLLSMMAVLWLWPSAAIGQSPSPALLDAYMRYQELFAHGQYEETMPFAEDA
jgi:hypothetical protein